MGQEIQCTVVHAGKRFEAKAYLETREVIIRGESRLVIRFDSVKSAVAADGLLSINHQGGTTVLELGAQADKWAVKILHPKGLLDKLGIKPESRVSVLGVRDEPFWDQLLERLRAAPSRKTRKDSDHIFYGVEKRAELQRIESLTEFLKDDGAVWIVRPKGSPDVSEAEVMAAGKAAGLVDTKVVSFSATHTAEKFVIPVARRATRKK